MDNHHVHIADEQVEAAYALRDRLDPYFWFGSDLTTVEAVERIDANLWHKAIRLGWSMLSNNSVGHDGVVWDGLDGYSEASYAYRHLDGTKGAGEAQAMMCSIEGHLNLIDPEYCQRCNKYFWDEEDE